MGQIAERTIDFDVMTVFEAIIALADATNAAPLNQYVGAWHCRIDDDWYTAVNGHNYRVDVTPDGVMPVTLEPFQAAVWWNGWLVGQFDPTGGKWFAPGAFTDVREFLAAAKERVKK